MFVDHLKKCKVIWFNAQIKRINAQNVKILFDGRFLRIITKIIVQISIWTKLISTGKHRRVRSKFFLRIFSTFRRFSLSDFDESFELQQGLNRYKDDFGESSIDRLFSASFLFLTF